MKFEDKGKLALKRDERQASNQQWWTDHTMSYDWKERSPQERFSKGWYDDIDARFLHGSRLFTEAANPFVELMGLENIAGKRVLEIGCGLGFPTELMLRAGARLTSIDLSPTSIEATRRRLELKQIEGGDVRQMDAEQLDFADGEFDMVWSWGVIHHSARTGWIVRQIHRVLKPGGTARLMVYNLEGMPADITMMTRYSFGVWRGRSIDELLWRASDGFTARYYSRDGWKDLLSTFFPETRIRFFGQDSDVVPLPRQIRKPFLNLLSRRRQVALGGKRGSLLYSESVKAAADA